MFRFLKRERYSAEAEAALLEADENLKRIERRNSEVKEVSRKLRLIRERNHFAEQIELLMRREHGRSA